MLSLCVVGGLLHWYRGAGIDDGTGKTWKRLLFAVATEVWACGNGVSGFGLLVVPVWLYVGVSLGWGAYFAPTLPYRNDRLGQWPITLIVGRGNPEWSFWRTFTHKCLAGALRGLLMTLPLFWVLGWPFALCGALLPLCWLLGYHTAPKLPRWFPSLGDLAFGSALWAAIALA